MGGLSGLSGLSGEPGIFGGFLPTDVTGLLGWYDFSDVSKLYVDSAMTTPVSADGNAIGACVDKSTSGNNITQAGAATLKPAYKTGIKNGLSISRYDGGDYLFRTDALGRGGSDTPMTVFVVSEFTSFLGEHTVVAFGSSINANPLHRIFTDATPNFDVQRRDDALTTALFDAGTPLAGAWYIITMLFYGTTLTVRVNGAVVGSAGTLFNVTALTLDRFAVGALLRAAAGSQHLGDIGEVLVYNSALATADYGNVETYLNQKWAVY